MTSTYQAATEAVNKSELVAVYGTLRTGNGNNRLLRDNGAERLVTERVKGFIMTGLGAGFPYAIPTNNDEETIMVEVWRLNPAKLVEGMAKLDSLEGYPSHYDRKLIETSVGKAWIYFIDIQDTAHFGNNRIIQGGDWNAARDVNRYLYSISAQKSKLQREINELESKVNEKENLIQMLENLQLLIDTELDDEQLFELVEENNTSSEI